MEYQSPNVLFFQFNVRQIGNSGVSHPALKPADLEVRAVMNNPAVICGVFNYRKAH
jgi:hypothetical protein